MDSLTVPPPYPDLAKLQKVRDLTGSQISTTSALIESLNEYLEKTTEDQRRLDAELLTWRQSLLEWIQSRDRVLRAFQCLDPHGAANPTSTSPCAQELVEQDNNVINTILESMETRELTISHIRSRISTLEEGIVTCKRESSNAKSMIALQASHKEALLEQYTSLPPVPRIQSIGGIVPGSPN